VIRVGETQWEGFDGLAEDLLEELRPEAEGAVFAAGAYFVSELKTTLTGQRSGRVYRVAKRKTAPQHQASREGEAPAVLFGHLRNSAGMDEPKWEGRHSVGVHVGIGLGVQEDSEIAENYALRLEYGGTDSRGVYMAPRPYMQPTVDRVTPRIDAMFAEIVGGAR